VVLWEPPDFQARRVSAELYDRLDRAAASGDRKLLVRLMINEVVGVARRVGLRRIVAGLHLDALVPRVIYRAQGHGGRVDRVPDLYRPLAGVQVGLVDGLVRIDHRQSDRAA
jgi:hypothetical protein